MSDTATTTPAEIGDHISYHQSSKPRAMSSTFVADDTDFHVMEVDMSVNGGFTYGATNPSNQILTITLYGAFESGLDPETSGAVFPIDTTGFTVPAGESEYTTTTDKFPFYLIRCTFAVVPDGATVTIKTCSWETN